MRLVLLPEHARLRVEDADGATQHQNLRVVQGHDTVPGPVDLHHVKDSQLHPAIQFVQVEPLNARLLVMIHVRATEDVQRSLQAQCAHGVLASTLDQAGQLDPLILVNAIKFSLVRRALLIMIGCAAPAHKNLPILDRAHRVLDAWEESGPLAPARVPTVNQRYFGVLVRVCDAPCDEKATRSGLNHGPTIVTDPFANELMFEQTLFTVEAQTFLVRDELDSIFVG